MKGKKHFILPIALVLSGLILSVSATIIYTFPVSNTTTGMQNPPAPTQMTVYTNLAVSPKTWENGQTITLTATLDHQLQNIKVDFYESGTWVGNAYTNSNGIATLQCVLPDVTVATQRSFTAQSNQ